MTLPRGQPGNQDLLFNGLLQQIYMGDDPDQAAALGQGLERRQGLTEGVLVQGAEALVHKEGVQPHGSRRKQRVRQPQGQTQRRLEGFAARKRHHAAVPAGAAVEDVQLQTGLAPLALGRPAAKPARGAPCGKKMHFFAPDPLTNAGKLGILL